MGIHVALLRGINVGGKHKLPMKGLAALFAEAGCREVRTYIQSGNVVFEAPAALVRRVPRLISDAVEEAFGFPVPVVLRTAAELAAVVRRNPFPKVKEGKWLNVAFLAERPSAAKVAKLDPDRSPPDEFRVDGREIYVHYPKGGARSKITNAWFDAELGTTSTVRNWNTVQKLLEMSGGK